MVDPTGRLIVLIRDNASVTSVTAGKVRGTERLKGWEPPFVIVRRVTSNPWIGDPRTETADVGTFRYDALCYGQRITADERVDDAATFRLAGLVSDSVNNHGILTFPLSAGTGVIFRIQEDSTTPALRDPATGEPFVVVTLTVLAGTQVLAA